MVYQTVDWHQLSTKSSDDNWILRTMKIGKTLSFISFHVSKVIRVVMIYFRIQ